MNAEKTMKIALRIEIVFLTAIVAAIYLSAPETAETYRLFELLGANLAAIITTYGLYKMRDIT